MFSARDPRDFDLCARWLIFVLSLINVLVFMVNTNGALHQNAFDSVFLVLFLCTIRVLLADEESCIPSQKVTHTILDSSALPIGEYLIVCSPRRRRTGSVGLYTQVQSISYKPKCIDTLTRVLQLNDSCVYRPTCSIADIVHT